jgi:hypothetical protein
MKLRNGFDFAQPPNPKNLASTSLSDRKRDSVAERSRSLPPVIERSSPVAEESSGR